ncbi:MAG: hypothetical protein PWP24_1853 [Clostridiales bacterium]|nr:hypothetical protein [Clostridiales bacterium]
MDEVRKLEIYDLLIDCAKKEDAISWNRFRRSSRKELIDLSNLSFSELSFEQFNFKGIKMNHANLSFCNFHLCIFDQADLSQISGFGSTFRECNMVSLQMMDGNFSKVVFENCDLRFSNLSASHLHQTEVNTCKLDYSNFKTASINDASLNSSSFIHCNLNDCEFLNTDLHSADFTACIVNGGTIFWDCFYNKGTNFTGVGLSNCRIEPILLSSFQCNIRRLWWMKWYQSHKEISAARLKEYKKQPIRHFDKLFRALGNSIMTAIVQVFWWITDYGASTIRLLAVFLFTTLSFASLYALFPALTNDNVLNYSQDHLFVFIRSLYFAVVVMTGLGFGDINADSSILWGHLVIVLQSLTGYILLGAFLVRIGILFQGEFPVSSKRDRNSPDTDVECQVKLTHFFV